MFGERGDEAVVSIDFLCERAGALATGATGVVFSVIFTGVTIFCTV